jgi:hypothetical protein
VIQESEQAQQPNGALVIVLLPRVKLVGVILKEKNKVMA